MQLRIDEINTFADYYGEMGLSEKRIQNRINVANRFLDAYLLVFALARRLKDKPYKKTEITAKLREEVIKSIPSTMKEDGQVKDPYLLNHIALVVASISQSIMRNGDWYTDYGTAWELAANEGNSIENYIDFEEEVKSGKTEKTWHTILDGRERETHRLVDGKTIPINDYFVVGTSYMRFPHDDSLGADVSELNNCRCYLTYH